MPLPHATAILARPLRAARALAPASVIVACGLLALAFGQANSWDLHNYHLYDGWAFWTGRGASDFAAAQVQTYFNPLLATATYLLFMHTPPWLSAVLLGLVQGFNVIPLHAIARQLLPAAKDGWRRHLPFAVAVAGLLGATQLSELGSSLGDNLVSLPILCALAFVLRPALARREALLAGLLVGLATGIKLIVAPFAAGVGACVVLLGWPQRERWLLIAVFGAAALAGLLISDGFWLLRMYREFGNPMHPMFSSIFGGPFAAPVPLRDARFIPRTFAEWLFYPLIWLFSPHRVSDTWFFDLRIPLAFLAAPVLIRRAPGVDRRRELGLIAALFVAYLLWLPLFGVYRYLAPLEMLAPLLVALALARFHDRTARTTGFVLFAAMLLCLRIPGWGRLQAYGAEYLAVDLPPFDDLSHATIVLGEDEPLAFLALGFPPRARFVRIDGNLMGPPFPVYAMDREAARRLAAADGPLYALLAHPTAERVAATLARQHLEFAGRCAPVRTNQLAQPVMLCGLRRAPGS